MEDLLLLNKDWPGLEVLNHQWYIKTRIMNNECRYSEPWFEEKQFRILCSTNIVQWLEIKSLQVCYCIMIISDVNISTIMGEMPVSSPINSKQKSKRLSGIRFDERYIIQSTF